MPGSCFGMTEQNQTLRVKRHMFETLTWWQIKDLFKIKKKKKDNSERVQVVHCS